MNLNRRGLFGTVFIHGLILALLILGGLTFPDPPPEEEGIMVNFGTDDTGFGFIEPKGDDTNGGDPEPVIAQAVQEDFEESIPDDPAPADPVYEDPVVEEAVVEEAVVEDNTQDIEETPVKEDPKPTAEEIRKQQEEIERINREKEAERIRKEEADRVAAETAERIRKEQEAERIRKAEEARIAQEEARIAEEKANISNRGKNAFGNAGAGSEDGSEGINPGTGNNQGVETGQVDAPNYGEGRGLGDGGDSFGLTGRNALSKGTPNVDKCVVTSRIIVKVEIQVDRQGNVILASVLTSTFSDKCIYDAVIAAAKKTKFNVDTDASYKQTGWIKYTIEP